MRATIRLQVGEIERIVDEAEAALIASDRGLYQRGDIIVSVGDAKAITACDGQVIVRRIFERGEHALVEDLSVAARFERYDGRSRGFVEVDPPLKVVKTLKDRTGRLGFPVLAGVIDAPTLRADGSILDKLGYDPATGLLYEPSATNFSAVPARPTRDQAHSAAGLLAELLDTFPFVGEADRSVALSAIITACVRRSLRTAPMHGFTAPTAGSGKSMLVDVASIIATGREAAVTAQGATEEELQKRLGAMLLAGDEKRSPGSAFDYTPAEFVAPDLREALLTVAGTGGAINSRRLGKWLSSNQKRISGGRWFENIGICDGVAAWKLCGAPHIRGRSIELTEGCQYVVAH